MGSGCPVSKLADPIISPALDPAGGGESAGMPTSSGYHTDPNGQADHIHRGGVGSGRPVPQLAVIISSPAFYPAEGGERAGVGDACGYRTDPAGQAGDKQGIRCSGDCQE